MAKTPSPRSSKEMIEFLRGHFRYHTMNSWNRAASYARDIKIHHLGLDSETENRCYEMLGIDEAFDDFSAVLDEFAIRHDYAWQIAQNGRSGGYLVLHRGGKKDQGYKTRCTSCRIPAWYETERPCRAGGCRGILKALKSPIWQIYTQPGLGVDDEGDYESMSHEDLCRRVILVKDFDKTSESAVKAFVDYARSHQVEEREILVPKKVRVAVAG